MLNHTCITCGEIQVRGREEECRDCYTKELKAFAEMKLGRDVQFTPQWTNEDLTSGQIY
jgi:hypothetical protein